MTVSGNMYVWGEKAKNVPERTGVYAFYNEDKVLIYIGESSNLKESFTHYLDTNFTPNPCKRVTKYYKREFTTKSKDRKKELLDEYEIKHGKLPECNLFINFLKRLHKKEVDPQKGFYFYEDVGKPLHQAALNLKDFLKKIGEVPITSIEFHQTRGDFARWIQDVIGNAQLANAIEKIKKNGEYLRGELVDLASYPEMTWCPKCGTRTNPAKMWEMTGRPSKTGEKLKLTIGHYKCPYCDKTFRKVIAKEKVKAMTTY